MLSCHPYGTSPLSGTNITQIQVSQYLSLNFRNYFFFENFHQPPRSNILWSLQGRHAGERKMERSRKAAIASGTRCGR